MTRARVVVFAIVRSGVPPRVSSLVRVGPRRRPPPRPPPRPAHTAPQPRSHHAAACTRPGPPVRARRHDRCSVHEDEPSPQRKRPGGSAKIRIHNILIRTQETQRGGGRPTAQLGTRLYTRGPDFRPTAPETHGHTDKLQISAGPILPTVPRLFLSKYLSSLLTLDSSSSRELPKPTG